MLEEEIIDIEMNVAAAIGVARLYRQRARKYVELHGEALDEIIKLTNTLPPELANVWKETALKTLK